jgi:hypothetical protein
MSAAMGTTGYWHPQRLSFAIAVAVMGALFATLLVWNQAAPKGADRFGDILIAASALYGSIIGVRGETWNAKGKGLGKVTWAGWMVVLGVVFGFGVAVFQKTAIASGLERVAQAAAAEEAAVKAKTHERELDAHNKEVDTQRQQIAHLSAQVELTRALQKTSAQESNEHLDAIKAVAGGCSPAARKAIESNTRELSKQLYVSTAYMSSGLSATLSGLIASVGALSTSVGQLPKEAVTAAELKSTLGDSGVLKQLIDATCRQRAHDGQQPVPGPSSSADSPAPASSVLSQASPVPSSG